MKNRSIPVKVLTKTEYDLLDDTHKNSDILYIVMLQTGLDLIYKERSFKSDIPTIEKVEEISQVAISNIPTVESYTKNGWYVRKYSDGFVEMINNRKSGTITGSSWTSGGSGYYIDPLFSATALPLTLVERYSFNYSVSIDPSSSSQAYGAIATDSSNSNSVLTHVSSITVWRFTQPPSSSKMVYMCSIVVTGRWK